MNLQKIKDQFQEINKVYFDKEGNNQFLRIEVNLKELEIITVLSREISEFIDSIDDTNSNYFLDIHSSGTDKVLEIDQLIDYVNENIQVEYSQENSVNELIGKMISVEEDEIIVKWNKKGQIKKTKINKSSILAIKLYAKL